jgi:hypothetical protein
LSFVVISIKTHAVSTVLPLFLHTGYTLRFDNLGDLFEKNYKEGKKVACKSTNKSVKKEAFFLKKYNW